MKAALIAGAAAILVAEIAPLARGSLLAYDGFDTSSGNGTALTAATDNDTTGWSSTWTTTTNSGTLTSGLTYSQSSPTPATYVTSGQASIYASLSGETNYRALSSPVSNTVGNVLWVSFLQNNSGNNKAQLSLYNSAGTTIATDIGTEATGFYGVDTGTAGGYAWNNSTSANSLNTTTLLVGELTYTGSATSTINLWVDPDITASSPGSPLLSVSLSTAITIGEIRLFDSSSAGTGSATFDEIRLGTTYGDVVNNVPEPMALGLLAPAAMLLATRRRRSIG